MHTSPIPAFHRFLNPNVENFGCGYDPAMGLKDAKYSIDAFINLIVQNEQLTIADSMSRDELIQYVVNKILPDDLNNRICEKYFRMNYVETIKIMRQNPATIMFLLVKNS